MESTGVVMRDRDGRLVAQRAIIMPAAIATTNISAAREPKLSAVKAAGQRLARPQPTPKNGRT